jgi:hypothetical protein
VAAVSSIDDEPVSCHLFLRRQSRWLAIEAVTFGLAYSAGLWWGSVCLLASFRPNDLSAPYWAGLPELRADTSGAVTFFAFAVFFCCSEFLRLRRGRPRVAARGGGAPFRGAVAAAALAVAETVAVLATSLVIYLSVNAVTHPVTLDRQATHFSTWPTEGTLRMIALVLCVFSVSALRFLVVGRRAELNVSA